MKPKKRRNTAVITLPKPCKIWDNVLLTYVNYDETTKRMSGRGIKIFPSKARANSAVWHEVHALIEEGKEPPMGRFSVMELPKQEKS